MNTRGIATEYRMAQWAQVMQERKGTGESVTAFCESRGIIKNTYFYWQRKIREAACEQLTISQSSGTHNGLPEFTVRKINDELVGIYRSGTDGLVVIDTLESSWYIVTENKAPEGYTLGDSIQKVEITHSKVVTIEFQNRAHASLVIKKIDEVTGAPLTGANFEVHKQGGAFVGEYSVGRAYVRCCRYRS